MPELKNKKRKYAYGKDTLYVHLYIAGKVEIKTGHGDFCVRQEGNYPWEGEVRLTVYSVPDMKSRIALRIPGWCHEFEIHQNGKAVEYRIEKGYAYLENGIRVGDEIHLIFIMPVELIQANPKVRANAGKAAIQRGPLVYCLEEEDNGSNLSAIRLDTECALRIAENVLPGGIPVITAKGYRTDEDGWAEELYRPYIRREKKVTVKAVPYFLWGNREPGEMLVWVRV